jgi:Tol biopolymer transport system component
MQIVFQLEDEEGPVFCSIQMMNADGTGMVDLTTGQNPAEWEGCEHQPSFTPDGANIVFGRYDAQGNTEAIWSMNLRGGARTQITDGIGRGVTDPNVSPDGATVSFIAYNGEELGQALMSSALDGTDLERLVPFRRDVAIKHDWAPDGDRIVFTDNADRFTKPANIATVRPDGTGLRYLTDLGSPRRRAYTGGYSPDGRWIVFRLEVGDRSALYRMHPDGTNRREILSLSSFRARFIDWGPQPTE